MVCNTKGMVTVPKSRFYRGSCESPDEQPAEMVMISGFLVDVAPVLNSQFKTFVESSGYLNPSLWTKAGWMFIKSKGVNEPRYWHDPNWNGDRQPVTGISWWEALAYAR